MPIAMPKVFPGRTRLVVTLAGMLWLLPMAANAVEPPELLAQSEIFTDVQVTELSDSEKERVGELLRDAQQNVDNENYSAAIAAYQQALSIDRNNARLYSGIGYLQFLKGDYQLAVESYRQAIDRDSRNVSFRYGLALSLYNAERYAEAADTYRAITRMAPNNQPDAFLGLGNMLLRLEEYDLALNALEEAVRLSPNNAQVYEAIGLLYIEQGRYDDALDPLQQALRLDNKRGSIHGNLAKIWIHQGRTRQAEESLRRAIAANPRDWESHYQLALMLEERDDMDAAFIHYEETVEANPSFVPAQAALGALLLEREQYIRAVISYRQIVRQYPEDAGARYNLGLAFWGQGQRDAAIHALERARDLYEDQDNETEAERATALLDAWGVDD